MTELAMNILPIYSLLFILTLIIDSCLKLKKWLNDQEALEHSFKIIFMIPVFITYMKSCKNRNINPSPQGFKGFMWFYYR